MAFVPFYEPPSQEKINMDFQSFVEKFLKNIKKDGAVPQTSVLFD